MELKYEYYIDALPKRVWELLILPEGTKQIFFSCVLESSFEIGKSLSYIGPGTDGEHTVHVYGNILAYEPEKLLSYTEHPGPCYHENHEELETRVTFTLEQVSSCTKLMLINDMWKDNHPGYEKADQAWVVILSNLKTLAETGKTMDLGW